MGRRPLPRLGAVGRRPRPHLRRAVARPVDVGVGRPGGRRRPPAARARAAVRPGAVGRLARGAAGHDPVAGVGVVEALPRRHGREAVVGRRGLGRVRPAPRGIDAQLESPMQVGDRLAFLSDHEGWGNLYSVDRSGGDLRRHTDHGGPTRPRSTCGTRAPTAAGSCSSRQASCGSSTPSTSDPRPLDVRLGGPRTAREPHRITTSAWLSDAVPDRTGRTSVVNVRGTVHRLTHRDGPARTLIAEPGVRARLAEPLGDDRAVWVDDADGEEAVTVAPIDPRAEEAAAAGPVLRRRAGAATGGGPGRPERRRGDARREAAARRPLRWRGRGRASWPAEPTARSRVWPGRPTRSGSRTPIRSRRGSAGSP